MATQAAYNAFLRAYSDPEGEVSRGKFQAHRAAYTMRWGYYQNTAFDDLKLWGDYKSRYKLYRHIRSIYNPAARLVDFYAGIVYPGQLTDDAESLPDGTPIAIPLPQDTPPALIAALAQVWQWANWQMNKDLFVTYGAALGDVFVYVHDDLEAGKVYPEIIWPGLITDLRLDTRGNVQMYQIEYDYLEADGRRYKYKRIDNKDTISTFRDDQPFSYDDVPAVTANPYGFVPAVWCKHRDLGNDHGLPAMRNIGKWDELNSLSSVLLDHDRKILNAPVLMSGSGGFQKLTTNQTKRAATSEMANPEMDQESIAYITGPADAKMQTADMQAGDIMLRVDSLLGEIEKDHPELGMYTQLREMSSVTGPGASRLFGDVETYVNRARSSYDTQSIKLFQMCIAVAGFRLQTGAWGPALTRQQEVFRPFNLESYAAGDLDFSIAPRPLLTPTAQERMQTRQQELSIELQEATLRGDNMTEAVGVA